MQLGQHLCGVGQAEFLERPIGKDAAPAVEHHHGLRAGFDLRVQVRRHGIGVDLKHAVHQVRAAVQHGLDQPVIVRARTFDHVAGQRPGAARKTDQRHAAGQGAADRGDRVEHVAQLVHVRHGQREDCGLVAHRRREAGTLAEGEAQPESHGVGDREDVGKKDGSVQGIALQRLQSHLGRVVDVGRQPHEAACAGAGCSVLRQVTAGLPHQPHGRVGRGQPLAGAQKAVVLERLKTHAPLSQGAGRVSCPDAIAPWRSSNR